MVLDKNTQVIHNVCLVQIKSADATIDLSELTTIYHTPSKITLSLSSAPTDNGTLHKKMLALNFPGLSTTDFNKFNEIVRGAFQVMVKLTTNDIYELASINFPMTCSIAFDINTGFRLLFQSDSQIPFKFRANQPEEGITTDGFNYDFNFYLS